jgi:hypothetical protein
MLSDTDVPCVAIALAVRLNMEKTNTAMYKGKFHDRLQTE